MCGLGQLIKLFVGFSFLTYIMEIICSVYLTALLEESNNIMLWKKASLCLSVCKNIVGVSRPGSNSNSFEGFSELPRKT